MRKISRESAKAFVNFEPYKKDNTEVVIDHLDDPLGKDARFYLHDNCIVLSGGNGVYRNIDLCGWHTATTRERINTFSPSTTNFGLLIFLTNTCSPFL